METVTWCEHPETMIRWRVNRAGIATWARQCLVCGYQVGPAISRKAPEVQKLAPTPFDEELIERYEELRRTQFRRQQILREQQAAQKQREWWQWYDRYLTTPQWKARRALVMKRAQGLCEGCRQAQAVQVHHLTYDHVGHEFLFELVALCTECHDRIHEEKAAS